MGPEPGSPATGSPGAGLTIGHVDAERGFSGGEEQVFLLLEGLRSAGVRNVLFCPPGSASEQRARELLLGSRVAHYGESRSGRRGGAGVAF